MRTSLRRSAYLLGLICVISATVGCSDEQSSAGQTEVPSSAPGAPAAKSSVESPPPQSLADAGEEPKTRVPDPRRGRV